mmetsp:Transcript_76/g.285  ORF Transcript_76/g.285 Transcript_76/m.285 type:complete len:277 (-) Transcript_76:221-1051(-)
MATSWSSRLSLPLYTCPIDAAAIGSGEISLNVSSMVFPVCSSIILNASFESNGGTRSCNLVSSSINVSFTKSGLLAKFCPSLTNNGPSSHNVSFTALAQREPPSSASNASKLCCLFFNFPSTNARRAVRLASSNGLASASRRISSGSYRVTMRQKSLSASSAALSFFFGAGFDARGFTFTFCVDDDGASSTPAMEGLATADSDVRNRRRASSPRRVPEPPPADATLRASVSARTPNDPTVVIRVACRPAPRAAHPRARVRDPAGDGSPRTRAHGAA